jgi:SulP family sulfate permease
MNDIWMLLFKVSLAIFMAGSLLEMGPNARFLEDLVNEAVAANPAVRHVILECPAVNTIDYSALESLEAINHRLKDGGITLHLSEVKGPIMDRLKRSHFLEELTGKVHLTQYDAVSSINPDLAHGTLEAQRLR